MKRLAAIIIILNVSLCFAQKNDNVWMPGYHYYPSLVPALDFYYGHPDTIFYNSQLEFFGADAGICNDSGDLQLYTNGSAICNYLNDTIQGSFRFNFDSALYAAYGNVDYPKQSVIVLPFPGHPGEYYVFHIAGHLWNSNQVQPVRMGTSLVDMNANSGLGSMIMKDTTLINDTLLFGTLQAVRHGNGRDWWIVIQAWKSNTFYKCLLTSSGVTAVTSQSTGPKFSTGMYYYRGQTVFSPDGSHYAIARHDKNQVCVYDFDRCSGNFTFREKIDSASFSANDIIGCSFSPNSRFLYVTNYNDLYQFNMDSSAIASSTIHIASWDGSGSFNPYYFLFHRLGPDGKIYIVTPSSVYMHVINDPDQPDTLCNFTQHSLRIRSYHSGYVPEFPNYRLGVLAGSSCDSLTAIIHGKSVGDFIVQYSLEYAKPGILEISDITGRKIFTLVLSPWELYSQVKPSVTYRWDLFYKIFFRRFIYFFKVYYRQALVLKEISRSFKSIIRFAALIKNPL